MLKKSILSIALKLDHAGKAFTFDMRELFNDANTAVLIDLANQLWAKIKHLGPEVLLGKGIGSYPLLLAVKMRAFELDKVCLSILFVRDQRKQTGLIKKEVEGPLPLSVFNKKTVFIDDIYNSGGTFEKTKDTVFSNDFNLDIVGIAVVVDFYKHSRILRAKGYPFFSLTNLIELGLSRRDKDLPKVFNAERWFNLNYQGEIEKRLIKSTPVIYKGNVYIGNDNTNHYCFDSQTGDLKWVHTSALPSFKGTAGITACHDDLVYWSSYDGTLTCAHYDTGKVVWKSKLDANLHSSPCLDVEGNRIFIGTEWDKQEDYGRGDVVCLEMSSGKEVWRTPTDGMIPSTALYIASKNTVVCGSNDFHVYFLQADTGEVKLKFPTYGEVKGKAVYSEQSDTVVVTTNFGHVYALSLKDNKLLWQRKVGDSAIHGFPLIDKNHLFVTNSGGFVVCLDLQTSEVIWVCRLRGSIGWSMTDNGQSLIVGTSEGYVVSIDKASGEKLTSDKIEGISIFQPVTYCKDTQTLIVAGNKEIFCYDARF